MITGFQTYFIKGKRVSEKEAIRFIMSCGGWIPTPAFTESDNLSKAICSDGNKVWEEDFFGNKLD